MKVNDFDFEVRGDVFSEKRLRKLLPEMKAVVVYEPSTASNCPPNGTWWGRLKLHGAIVLEVVLGTANFGEIRVDEFKKKFGID